MMTLANQVVENIENNETDEEPTVSLKIGAERRQYRRHDLENQGITVERWDGNRRIGKSFGKLVDISAGGVRLRAEGANVKPDAQIRVRITLPDYAGISPFIYQGPRGMEPRREWVGWMTVVRVNAIDERQSDVAGRLVDMDEMDRGMLGLYLSTHPIAA
jgi:hypothetical protein